MRNSYELQPVENYKGKSLEELEAILDAHNKARGGQAAPHSGEAPGMPRNSSAAPEEKKDAAPPQAKETRHNSQKRPSELRNGRVGAKQGSQQGPRPSLPKAQSKNKENEQALDQRKGYGKVPKYL